MCSLYLGFVIIKVLFHIHYYWFREENCLLYRGVSYRGSLYQGSTVYTPGEVRTKSL